MEIIPILLGIQTLLIGIVAYFLKQTMDDFRYVKERTLKNETDLKLHISDTHGKFDLVNNNLTNSITNLTSTITHLSEALRQTNLELKEATQRFNDYLMKD